MSVFAFELVTPEKVVFSGQVRGIQVPGVSGSLGVHQGHAPLMTGLVVGPVRVEHENGDTEFIAVSGGFLEVKDNHAVVLADTAERVADIDVRRVEEAIARARARLEGGDAADYIEARDALQRAMNRLRLTQASNDSNR